MAAPPVWLDNLVTALPSLPVVVVVAQESSEVPDDYDTDQATARSLPVGAVMGTNVLARRHTVFDVVVGELGQALVARIGDTVRAAAAAAAVRRLRLGTVGEPIAGYTDVEVTAEQLAVIGITVVDVADDLDAAFAATDASDASGIPDDFDGDWSVEVDAPVLERSARLASALEYVVGAHALDGGAVNCHGPRLRFGADIGITACLAVSRCSAAGRPFACTGDIPTAIALALGRRLAGAALYCELYQLDHDRNWLLVANGGEGDWTLRDPDHPVRLLPEDHYLGEHGPGVAVAFKVRRGPATLVSLSPAAGPDGRWQLVSAAGEVLGSRHHHMEGPNAMFRFDRLAVRDGYAAWCRAGATHHAALLPGTHTTALDLVARLLDISHVAVGSETPR
jgi:L-arabinose isomerase